MFDVANLRTLYIKYGRIQLGNIERLFGRYGDEIKLKIEHGISMSYEVPKIMMESNLFHESYYDSFAIDGLFHDIGRFKQYEMIGSLSDSELENLIGIKDHGRLGEILLQSFEIQKQLGLVKNPYLQVLQKVVGNHTKIYNPEYRISLSDLNSIFKEYSLEEIINYRKWINLLIGAKIQLVVEADNVELLQNIITGKLPIVIYSEKEKWVTEEVWKLFIENKPIFISEMKKHGTWSNNSGVILRFGLLPQKANIRSTLERILKEDYFRKMYEKMSNEVVDKEGRKTVVNDPLIKEGYLYATLLTENIIKMSDIIITREQREQALELTKKIWYK